MKLAISSIVLGAVLSVSLFSSQAQAHWCDDLWASSYNLVVRPETDTVTVPSSGSATLTIHVQNNMEYALPNFKLTAEAAGATITATRQTEKVKGTMMPGEKAKYSLAITKSGGGTVNATDLDFSVSFGNSGQNRQYPTSGGRAAMIKLTDGSLSPTPPPPGVGQGGSQATQLYLAALADFSSTDQGLDKLMGLYCAGRGSWNSSSSAIIKSNCPDATTTVCPTETPDSGNGSKFDYMHLWSAGELAARKSALGSRAAILRARLKCGINDANNGFAGFAMFVLGYLGEDPDARSFIEGKISAGGDLGTIAKAALLLMDNPDDLTKYKADVTAGTASNSIFVKAACAAALGIVAKDDTAVTNTLFPLCKWTEPDTSDNGQAIYSAQLLNLVAWDRRGWAPNAGDTGAVTFYGETASGSGGNAGAGGRAGSGGTTSSTAAPGTGGRGSGRGGSSGGTGLGNGGSTGRGNGGRAGSGGVSTMPGGTGGTVGGSGGNVVGSGGNAGAMAGSGGDPEDPPASGGTAGAAPAGKGGSGGSAGPGGDGAIEEGDAGSGCKCSVGSDRETSALAVLVMGGLFLLLGRRRRR